MHRYHEDQSHNYLHFPGRFLNYYYRRTVQKLSNGNGRSFNGHEPDFPIEKTRLKGAYMLIIVSGLGTLGYGLALMTRAVRGTHSAVETGPLTDNGCSISP